MTSTEIVPIDDVSIVSHGRDVVRKVNVAPVRNVDATAPGRPALVRGVLVMSAFDDAERIKRVARELPLPPPDMIERLRDAFAQVDGE